MNISVLVPVLGRPQNAVAVTASLRATSKAALVFVATKGDDEQIAACLDASRLYPDVQILIADWQPEHDYPRKMNLAFRHTASRWVLLGSDDITFTEGWEDEMLNVAARHNVRVVGSNDKANRIVMQKGLFSTHSLVARSYVEEEGASLDGPGSLVSEAYDHNFVDRELAGLAMSRGEWAMAQRAIIRHHHPAFGGAPQDDTYLKGKDTFHDDQELFWTRSERWGRAGLLPQELSIIDRSAKRIARRQATARSRRRRP